MLADGAMLDHGPHRRAAGARPDLPEHRRPDRRARPERRQQEGRADRPARDHRRELRRPGRAVPPDHRRTSASSPARSTTTRRSCSAPPGEIEGFVSTLAQERQHRAPVQRVAGLGLRHARGRARATWPPSLRNLGDRDEAGRGLREGEPRDPRPATSRASTGSPRCWSSSAARSTRSLTDAPVALNNLVLTYNPQAGTLDTRANIGELGQPDRRPTRPTFLCGILDQADQRGQACDADQAASALPPAAARFGQRRRRPRRRATFDPTLGGLVEVHAMSRRLHTARAAACSSLVGALLLTGCDFSVYSCRCPAAPTSATTRSPCTSSSATCSTWCPQSTVKVDDVTVGKVDRHQARRLHRRGHAAAAQRRQAARQRRRRRSGRPACSARSSSRSAPPTSGASTEPARRRRRHPARAHRPQPRGRGGARRAQPAAQRRRGRPSCKTIAQRAQQGPRRPRGHGPVGARPDPHAA